MTKSLDMAGIYFHIPFCRQRCHYCDFYTTTQLNKKQELILALQKELLLRKSELAHDEIQTIYFGGGTPSLLNKNEICLFIESVKEHFQVSKNAEITLEANPDDLTTIYLNELASSPVNRLSVGIQSFHDADLKLTNRRHSAEQALQCIKMAQEKGFHNISIDLIYGLPNSSLEKWNQNLEITKDLHVQHLSAYHLTYEKGTVFDIWNQKKKIIPISDEESILQFQTLVEWAVKNNFIHYEISNFAVPDYLSQHNTSYWQQKKYMGLGPSAHSYNRDSRSWNVSNLPQYLAALSKDELPSECEWLTETDKFNDFIITSLRTRWGISLEKVQQQFGTDVRESLVSKVRPFIDNKKIYEKDGCLVLTNEGVFLSDMILAELIKIEDD